MFINALCSEGSNVVVVEGVKASTLKLQHGYGVHTSRHPQSVTAASLPQYAISATKQRKAFNDHVFYDARGRDVSCVHNSSH